MNTRLLIDGYNLIFQVGLNARHQSPDALERARTRLLTELVINMDLKHRREATVIFDAKQRPVKEVDDAYVHDGIAVQYAVGFPDADSMIEELIRKSSVPKQLTVVSSDHRLQTAANRRKATAIDSDVWYDRLLSGYYQSTTHPPGSHGDSQSDSQLSTRENESLRETFQMSPDEIAALQAESETKLDDQGDAEIPSGDSDIPDFEEPFSNPFPDGYGEDLLDQ